MRIWLAVLWVVGIVLIGLAFPWVGIFAFRVVPWPVLPIIWLLFGLVLAVASGVAAWRARSEGRMRPVLVAAFLALAVPLGAWAQFPLMFAGERLHFSTHFGRYRELADSLSQAQPGNRYGESAGIAWVSDSGPPLRVAFPRLGWLSDWDGIIFDPTDSLAQWQQHSPRGAIPMFGKRIFNCERRAPSWYWCGAG